MAGVGGEGGDRAPGEVGGQPPPQQRVVGPEGVADGADRVPAQGPDAARPAGGARRAAGISPCTAGSTVRITGTARFMKAA